MILVNNDIFIIEKYISLFIDLTRKRIFCIDSILDYVDNNDYIESILSGCKSFVITKFKFRDNIRTHTKLTESYNTELYTVEETAKLIGFMTLLHYIASQNKINSFLISRNLKLTQKLFILIRSLCIYNVSIPVLFVMKNVYCRDEIIINNKITKFKPNPIFSIYGIGDLQLYYMYRKLKTDFCLIR